MIIQKIMKMSGTLMNSDYWEKRYEDDHTGWDIGYISTPIKEYIDQLTDKKLKILIPGAGNSYEAQYLFEQGFQNIYVLDIARAPLKSLQKRVPGFPENQLLYKDFFQHSGQYDLILEQTFFCALPPRLRDRYVQKTYTLLKTGGKLAGVLFDFPLTENGPPFGGEQNEYQNRFQKYYHIKTLERCYNSIPPRMGNELFFIFEKK